jgi:hypothetical protein
VDFLFFFCLCILFRFIVAGQVSQSEAETAKWKKNPHHHHHHRSLMNRQKVSSINYCHIHSPVLLLLLLFLLLTTIITLCIISYSEQQSIMLGRDIIKDELKRNIRLSEQQQQQQQPIVLYVLPKFPSDLVKDPLQGDKDLCEKFANQWAQTIKEQLFIEAIRITPVSPRKVAVVIPAEYASQLEQVRSLLRSMDNVEHVELKMQHHIL